MVADVVKDEAWLVSRIDGHIGRNVLEGALTAQMRRDQVRAAIIVNGLEWVVCGRGADRRPRTYGEAYLAIYGQKLDSGARALAG